MSYSKLKTLLITSGGDSPGMNAAIRAVVRTANYYGMTIYACHNGFNGMIDGEIFKLRQQDVAGCIQRGGTILKSGRCPSFLDPKIRAKCHQHLHNNKITNLIVIGGDGSFRGASTFEQETGLKTIGIPGTIDNDIIGTEYTIGFDSACNTALHAVDNIRDTAFSNDRYFIVEVMGQRAGFLAAHVGLAGGAEYILVPEFPIEPATLAKHINAPRRKKQSLIIVAAEAGRAGHSVTMAAKLKKLTPFEYRVCILGYIQRGGTPTVMDRKLASQMGNLAINAMRENKSNCYTALQDGKLTLAPLPKANSPYRKLANNELLKLGVILAS